MSVPAVLRGGSSLRLNRDELERPCLLERLSSLLDSVGFSPLDKTLEFLGLSDLLLLRILDPRERNEREDSLVSDRLKDG